MILRLNNIIFKKGELKYLYKNIFLLGNKPDQKNTF